MTTIRAPSQQLNTFSIDETTMSISVSGANFATKAAQAQVGGDFTGT